MLSFARVRAIAVVALLVIGAAIVIRMALTQDSAPQEAQERCPDDFVLASLTLPEESDVQINLYNGTTRAGLANRIGDNFTNRNFQVLDREDHDSEVEGIAELRYGPQAVGAAQLVGAYFLNEATRVFDIDREGTVVDVVLGAQFQQLATPTEVHQAIAAAGNPDPPAGTCPAPE